MKKVRKWSRIIHRDLSYFLSGMVIIYALSGIYMNHRDSINPHHTIERIELELEQNIHEKSTKEDLAQLLTSIEEEDNYTHHYSPGAGEVKVFLKGGSNLHINTADQSAVYEKLRRRPLISSMVSLHYNPGRWWTHFADFFAISLIIITITGIVMVRGRKGLWGRGGIELLIGIAIPILFLLL